MQKINLRSHQIIPVKFMKDNYGLILYHSLGSGKTITSIAAMIQFKDDIIIIGQKSSKKAFMDELNKVKPKNKIEFLSFTKVKNLIYDDIEFFKGKSVIVDEAHHLRNPTKDNIFLSSTFVLANRIMLLTATPIVNYLNDIAPLVNIVKKSDVLPIDRAMFNYFYFDEDDLRITNEESLFNKLKNTISYYKNKNDPNFPKSELHDEFISMSDEQINAYRAYVKKYIYDDDVSQWVDLLDVNFDALKKKKKNYFLSATRQISNTVDNDANSPKIKEIVSTVKDNNKFPVVIYSNFLKNGIFPVAKLLDDEKITYKMITGTTKDDMIIQIVNDYNDGKFQVLLLSSAGSESLDLKNTRQIHIMEPHWNESKIKQVIGRAIRYKSHNSLSEKNRFVDIYIWCSIFPKHINLMSADQYLLKISKKKKNIYKKFKEIIKKASIEENL